MSENPYSSTRHSGDSPGEKRGARVWVTVLTFFGIGTVLICLLLPAVRSARGPARRAQCGNNLKQIALALLTYETVYHALPPAYTVDADGKPLHSWRTLILPYLEQQRLYETIDLAKAWDDPANAEVCKTEVSVFRCPSDESVSPPGHTTYLASVAPSGCFRPTEARFLSEITDRLSQTLMVIEAPPAQSVPWMSPKDADEQLVLSIGPNSKLSHVGGTHAAMCDGSVHFLQADLQAADRRALISIAGGDSLAELSD